MPTPCGQHPHCHAGDDDARFLHIAARLAHRGHGGAEPNPLVGCVLAHPEKGEIVGWGYHRQCGREHAEIHALRRAGARARGATAYITLEPCNHTGRTGPCAAALIQAGIARAVVARRDPNPAATGGLEALRKAGIRVEMNDSCAAAIRASEPFVRRIGTGLPWVIAKWAQTLDGRIATRTGESRWLSCGASRTMVHRERGRVDAILTGIGTVLRDDPMLTARDVRVRRVARRIVLDPLLQTPAESQLAQTARQTPTIIICGSEALSGRGQRHERLRQAGVQFISSPMIEDRLLLAPVMRELVTRFGIATVLIDGGAGLLGQLFAERLVNEAWVFIAPLLLGDEQSTACVRGLTAPRLTDGVQLNLLHARRRGGDMILCYGVGTGAGPANP